MTTKTVIYYRRREVDGLVVGDVGVDVVGESTCDVRNRRFESVAQFFVTLRSVGQALSEGRQLLQRKWNFGVRFKMEYSKAMFLDSNQVYY